MKCRSRSGCKKGLSIIHVAGNVSIVIPSCDKLSKVRIRERQLISVCADCTELKPQKTVSSAETEQTNEPFLRGNFRTGEKSGWGTKWDKTLLSVVDSENRRYYQEEKTGQTSDKEKKWWRSSRWKDNLEGYNTFSQDRCQYQLSNSQETLCGCLELPYVLYCQYENQTDWCPYSTIYKGDKNAD